MYDVSGIALAYVIVPNGTADSIVGSAVRDCSNGTADFSWQRRKNQTVSNGTADFSWQRRKNQPVSNGTVDLSAAP